MLTTHHTTFHSSLQSYYHIYILNNLHNTTSTHLQLRSAQNINIVLHKTNAASILGTLMRILNNPGLSERCRVAKNLWRSQNVDSSWCSQEFRFSFVKYLHVCMKMCVVQRIFEVWIWKLIILWFVCRICAFPNYINKCQSLYLLLLRTDAGLLSVRGSLEHGSR